MFTTSQGGLATSSSPVAGDIAASWADGSYGPTALIAGSNMTISTSTYGQITFSSSGGGSSFAYPFPSNATSTVLTFSDSINVGDSGVIHNGDSNTLVGFSTDQMSFTAGGVTFLQLLESGTDIATFNSGNLDVDFVVRSDTHTDALAMDGATGNLTFGAYDCSGNANGGALTADASGAITCTDDDSGGSSFSYPFPSNATSTTLTFSGGLLSTASSTVVGHLTAGHFFGDITGQASTSLALAANGSNCSAGNFPLGVDASGAVESCTDAWTEAENTAAGYNNWPWPFPSAATSTNINFTTGLTTEGDISLSTGTELNWGTGNVTLTHSNNLLTLSDPLTLSSGAITVDSTTATSTLPRLSVQTALDLFGTFGTALSDFCVAITGGSGLCDGTDNTGGGNGLATSTAIADTYVIYGTSESDVGAEAAFTYDDATNLLNVDSILADATTTSGAIQAGSTAIGANVFKLSPLTGLTTSNSESVGGVMNMNLGTTDAIGFAGYTNSTGSNRLMSLVSDDPSHTGSTLHVRGDQTGASPFNLLGAPQGLGIAKIGSNGVGDADSSGLSIDTSLSSFIGQGIFVKGNNQGNILTLRNAGSVSMFDVHPLKGASVGTTTLGTADNVSLTVAATSTATTKLASFLNDTAAEVAYFDDDGLLQIEGAFNLGTGGVTFTDDADGALTIQGAGTGQDEDLTLNFDDVANTIDFTSSTGVTVLDFNTLRGQFGRLAINDTVQNSIGLEILTDSTVTQGLRVESDVATRLAMSSFVTGDGQVRFTARTDGLLAWGDGTSVADTNLFRGGANLLQTNDSLTVDATTTATGAFVGPVSTNPVIDTSGELAVNTTAASSSLRYHDGTAERALYDIEYKTYTIASSTLNAYQGQTASSTIPLGVASPHGETWTEIACYTDTGTVGVEFGDNTNWMDYQSLSTTLSTDGSLSNNTFTTREKRYIRVGQASSLGTLTCSVGIRQGAD